VDCSSYLDSRYPGEKSVRDHLRSFERIRVTNIRAFGNDTDDRSDADIPLSNSHVSKLEVSLTIAVGNRPGTVGLFF
jgi:hypothetical protein